MSLIYKKPTPSSLKGISPSTVLPFSYNLHLTACLGFGSSYLSIFGTGGGASSLSLLSAVGSVAGAGLVVVLLVVFVLGKEKGDGEDAIDEKSNVG